MPPLVLPRTGFTRPAWSRRHLHPSSDFNHQIHRPLEDKRAMPVYLFPISSFPYSVPTTTSPVLSRTHVASLSTTTPLLPCNPTCLVIQTWQTNASGLITTQYLGRPDWHHLVPMGRLGNLKTIRYGTLVPTTSTMSHRSTAIRKSTRVLRDSPMAIFPCSSRYFSKAPSTILGQTLGPQDAQNVEHSSRTLLSPVLSR